MENDRQILKTAVPVSVQVNIRLGWFSHALKRLLDIVASLLGLFVLSPVFVFLALLIKRESPGPVFYRGPRLGKDGLPFGILKFRTMYEDAASYEGPRLTAQGDTRITPLGQWLRETKLNELPQLWNVLVGEMSLVGPRPEDPELAKAWPREAFHEIVSVRPGITSPASILYRNEEKMLDPSQYMDQYLHLVLPDKIRLDQLYVRNHTLLSDIDIIFWTFLAVLPSLRTNPIPTESLYNGLIKRFASRYFSWFLVDWLVAFAAVAAAGTLWRLYGPLDLGFGRAVGFAALMAAIFSLINSKLGLGRVWWHHARPAYVFDLAFSSGLSTLLLLTLDWFWPAGHFLPMGMILEAGLLALLGFVSVRYRERLLTGMATRWLEIRGRQSLLGERVLIVGAGECGLLANWLLQRSKLSSGYSVVGMVDDDPTKTGLTVDGFRVLGLTRRIPEIVQQRDVGLILFAIENIDMDEQERILRLCRQTSARLVLIPDLMQILSQRLGPARETPREEQIPWTGSADGAQGGVPGAAAEIPAELLPRPKAWWVKSPLALRNSKMMAAPYFDGGRE